MYGRETSVGYQKSTSSGSLDARLLEQRLRLRRVVRVLHDVVRVPEQRRRHELLRHLAAAGVEVVDDGLAVETGGNCLPHLELVDRRHLLVDRHVADVERRPVEDLEAVVALDRLDVLRLDEVVALDLAVLQRLEARGVVRDRPEDQLLELRLLAPVVVVPHHHEPVTARPRLELERAGAGRVLGAVGAGRLEAGLLVDRALVRAVLLQRLRAREREVRQRERAEERGRRLRQVDDDGVLVRRLTALVEARASSCRRSRRRPSASSRSRSRAGTDP